MKTGNNYYSQIIIIFQRLHSLAITINRNAISFIQRSYIYSAPLRYLLTGDPTPNPAIRNSVHMLGLVIRLSAKMCGKAFCPLSTMILITVIHSVKTILILNN